MLGRAWPSVRAERVVYAAAAGYGLVLVGAAALHYFAFQEGRLDLGDMVQAIWSTAHGHVLQTSTAGGADAVRLGAHVDPFLVLLVPLWWIWPSPLLLLVLQALAVAAGALPVFWLGRKHLHSGRAAANFALAYLLFPATQYQAYTVATGFHPVSLAVPLVLFAIWFLDEERLVPFAVFALLAATTKEEIPLAVGCLGLWYAFRKHHLRTGLAIFGIGLTATLVNFLVVIPHYAPGGVNPFAGRYAAIGGTPLGIAKTAFTDPLKLIEAAASAQKLAFLLLLLVPFLGLWLREPLLFLCAVPDLAINLLSAKPLQTNIGYHYAAGIIPFVVAASILGAGRLGRRAGPASLAALAVVAVGLPLSPLRFVKGDAEALRSPARAAKIHALGMIPPGVPVTASDQLAGYLSERPTISIFQFGRRGSWLVVDRNDPTYPSDASYHRAVARLAANPAWRLVYSSHGVEVFRRRSGDA